MLREVTPVDLRPADASDVSKRGVFTQAVNENEAPNSTSDRAGSTPVAGGKSIRWTV